MLLSIDDADPRPPYEQLSSQLLAMITRGDLGPGDRLAPIRQLSSDLGIAPNTVARAYRELEQVGAIASRGRRGTTVTDGAVAAATSRHERRVVDALDAAVEAASAAGLSADDLVGLLRRRLAN
ncbi:MAG: GntR family transcriptional regulator [Actinomycetota bacterium]